MEYIIISLLVVIFILVLVNLLKNNNQNESNITERLGKLEVEVKEMESKGETLNILENNKTRIERELDDYYKVTTSNKHSGNNYMSQEIRAKMKVDETSSFKFDNRSILFVYKTPEEEDFLVDYIKYLTQQVLAAYHPESVRVSIINRDRSNKFNNLQISLDKFNEKTQELEEGPPYCDVYSETNEIKEVLQEQLTKLSQQNTTDMIDKNFDEMVLHRREIGGIVPSYNINILHREELSSEIVNKTRYIKLRYFYFSIIPYFFT